MFRNTLPLFNDTAITKKKKKNAFRRSAETYDVEVRNTKDLDNALYLARK